MTSPTPPPPSGSSPPPATPDGDAAFDIKPWLPAIGLGVVLILLLAFFFLRSDGGDTASTTTTSSSTTTTSTSTSTTTSSTTTTTSTPPTTAPPTTAPPTTAPPTTAPPTTAPPTTTPANPEQTALIQRCGNGDEFACYEVGRQGLTPPSSIQNPGSWSGKSDDEVVTACQSNLNLTACYVAGARGIELGD